MANTNSISKMTLGTVQLGLNYGIANKEGKPDQEKAFRILDSALASGINCLDTAADYGDSEKVIGEYLHSVNKRSELFIVTKLKLGNIPAPEIETRMRRSVENSLKNLRTDYLDILLLHDANDFSGCENEITAVMEKLLSEGTIRMAGASCYNYREIEPMLGEEIYHAFQIPVNLLDMRITRSPAAEKLMNRLIFARSVYLQGLFFMDPSGLKGNLREIEPFLIKINEISEEFSIPVDKLAVCYVSSLSYINSLVVGADNPEQVKINAGLLDSVPFDQETVNRIEEKLKGAPDWLFKPWLWDKQK
jgi:aryl-alcohol dehydrogenase-like predicted oxidoreductase